MLRSAVTATSRSIVRFLSSAPSEERYDLADDEPGTSPGTLRIMAQITNAAKIAGSTLTRSTSRHIRKARAPAVTSGPSTSPTLPPVPCRDMAKPRLSGNRLESAPIAGG